MILTYPTNPYNGYSEKAVIFSDMNSAADWTNYGTGGQNSFAIASLGDANRVGILESSTLASATASAGVGTAVLDGVVFGTREHRLTAFCRLPTLSTAAQRYSVNIGFGDSRTSTGTDAVQFRYSDATSANWTMEILSNGIGTANVDTGIAADTNWHRFEILVAADASRAQFFIDGVRVGNVTANIPSGSTRATGVVCQIIKSVGTTARTLLTDALALEVGTAR